MRIRAAVVLSVALLGAGAIGCGPSSPHGAAPRDPALRRAAAAFDPRRAFDDVRAQVGIGPRAAGSAGGREEAALITRRLRDAGFRDVRVQDPLRNVVATLPGTAAETVVVGAHHDTKAGIPGFVGANDGGSGVAVLLELARVLPRPFPGPSITFAFFDAEEARGGRPFESDGTRGSRQFVERARAGERAARQGAPPLGGIDAMYLVDMVGDCGLQIPREAASDSSLYDRLQGPAFAGESGEILDDQIPFVRAGIPAVDLIDFTYGPGGTPGAYWHTAQDSLAHVCPASLGQVGRALIGALGGGP